MVRMGRQEDIQDPGGQLSEMYTYKTGKEITLKPIGGTWSESNVGAM
jgi:hypothetical protein